MRKTTTALALVKGIGALSTRKMIQWIIFSEERADRPRECPNKQSAKGATFALLATMLRGWFRENMEPRSRKKIFIS